jgi:hypothetical protein
LLDTTTLALRRGSNLVKGLMRVTAVALAGERQARKHPLRKREERRERLRQGMARWSADVDSR